MHKIRLFGQRLSPFVEKVARVLQIKSLEFDLVAPKSFSDFKKWNPRTGKMPVLEIDDVRHHDSSFIAEHLETTFPEPALWSADPSLKARQRFIEDWSDESFYWYTMGMRWAPENSKATTAQIVGTLPVLLRPLLSLVLPQQIGGAARAQGLARLPMADLERELGRRFDEILVWLGDKPYLFSDTVGIADIALFGQMTTLCSGPTPQGARLLDQREALRTYYDRVDRTTAPRSGAQAAQRAA